MNFRIASPDSLAHVVLKNFANLLGSVLYRSSSNFVFLPPFELYAWTLTPPGYFDGALGIAHSGVIPSSWRIELFLDRILGERGLTEYLSLFSDEVNQRRDPRRISAEDLIERQKRLERVEFNYPSGLKCSWFKCSGPDLKPVNNSALLKYSWDPLIATFVHEMAHLADAALGDDLFDESNFFGHGERFIKTCSRIAPLFGWKAPANPDEARSWPRSVNIFFNYDDFGIGPPWVEPKQPVQIDAELSK